MTNNIIFLDIDGPMISYRSLLYTRSVASDMFDPCAVALLNMLIDATDSKLVISSSWRHHGKERIIDVLTKNNIDCNRLHEDWSTPARLTSSRTQEISWWLHEHPEVDKYVALDDEELDDRIVPGFVRCDTHEGFSYRNYLEAREQFGVASTQQLSDLHYIRRKTIWSLFQMNDPRTPRSWQIADELFPVIKYPLYKDNNE